MCKMQVRKLLETKPKPSTVPGHILCIAAFAREERREGVWRGPADTLAFYAKFKKINLQVLREGIEAYWQKCGCWPRRAEDIVEELSRP